MINYDKLGSDYKTKDLKSFLNEESTSEASKIFRDYLLSLPKIVEEELKRRNSTLTLY